VPRSLGVGERLQGGVEIVEHSSAPLRVITTEYAAELLILLGIASAI
jgi:hypothetical protein